MNAPISIPALHGIPQMVWGGSGSEETWAFVPHATLIALVETAEAARPFADGATCLDKDCIHRRCVLNKALAQFDFGEPS